MAAPSFFIRSLIRIASLQGRSVLVDIVTGQFDIVSRNGGKMATSLSANGKSFAFQIDFALTTSQLMAAAEEALSWFDGSSEAQITAILAARPRSTTVAVF